MQRTTKFLIPLVGLLLVSQIHGETALGGAGKLVDPLPFTTTEPDTTVVPTTTPATTTTTPKTTTSSTTTTTSTTLAPSTTTPAAPTTPAPAQVGSWNVTDTATNVTCIMLKMSVQMSVEYTKTDNKTATMMLSVPVEGSTASGTCGNSTQSISISWKPTGLAASEADKLDIEFILNATTKMYHVSSIDATIFQTNFPDAAGKGALSLAVTSEKLPSAPLAMSYRCTPVESFNLTGNSVLSITELQLQAFHVASDDKFGAASDCQAADTADIVPIVVGCALAGLVVIVLVAYLIGRRRSRQSGYLSM